MATEIKMPQLSDTMNEGTILTWFKKQGDVVERGDALAEVSTDKADLEIESFYDGTMLKILAPEGSTVKTGEVIAIVGSSGEDVTSEEVSVGEQISVQKQFSVPESNISFESSQTVVSEKRIKASPLAKNIAKQHGIDLSTLNGTGEGGRIVRRDVDRAIENDDELTSSSSVELPSPESQQVAAPLSVSESVKVPGKSFVQPFSKMRNAIASRMSQSLSEIPHFYTTSAVEVDELVKVRTSLKKLPQYKGITFNHMIIKATALALQKVPVVNSAYDEKGIILPPSINVGIVTALEEEGLLIPVLHGVEELGLMDIVIEATTLVQRTRSGRLKPADLSGATFSISNMGVADVESFTAIISPGQGGILSVAPIRECAIVKDGKVLPSKVMRLTLSVDHRIIDGLHAAKFMTELVTFLEDPVLLLA